MGPVRGEEAAVKERRVGGWRENENGESEREREKERQRERDDDDDEKRERKACFIKKKK